MLKDTLTCTLHIHKPTVQPVASCSLFLDIQEVTMLLGECTLIARANLYYPTIRLRSYFSTIFVAYLRVYTCSMGCIYFIYLGFYIAFNTVQVISRRVVGRAEETSTYSLLEFCTVNCRPTASNYQLCHLRP